MGIMLLEGAGCTHAKETERGTEDGTKQRCFGVDVLGRSNGLNYLSDDTTTMHTVSLLPLWLKSNYFASSVHSHCFSLSIEQRLVVIGKILVDSYSGSASNRSKQIDTSGGSL